MENVISNNERVRKGLEEMNETLRRDPEALKQFMLSAGFINRNGKLKKKWKDLPYLISARWGWS